MRAFWHSIRGGTALACLLLMVACENNPEEVVALSKPVQEVEEARNIKAVFSQTARLKAILEAPLMYRVKADTIYTEFPKSVFVTFYDSLGNKENVLRAGYARYFEMLQKVYMRDSVVVFNLKGDTLFARDLWWDQNDEVFYSDKPVKVHRGLDRLDGDGIRAKSDFSKTTIINARGPVAIPDSVGM